MKAQTIRLGSEASILLQWQTTPDNVSHSSMLGVANNETLIHTVRRSFMERMRNYRGRSLRNENLLSGIFKSRLVKV